MNRAAMKAIAFGQKYSAPIGQLVNVDYAALEGRVLATPGFQNLPRWPKKTGYAKRRRKRSARLLYGLYHFKEAAWDGSSAGGITLSRADAYRLTQFVAPCGGRFVVRADPSLLRDRDGNALYQAALYACCADHCDAAYYLGQLRSQVVLDFEMAAAIRTAIEGGWKPTDAIDAVRAWNDCEAHEAMSIGTFMRAWLSER